MEKNTADLSLFAHFLQMLARMARPVLPQALQRDIRARHALKSRGGPSSLPPGWQTAESEEGKTYYFHSETGETRWERPQEDATAKSKISTSTLVVKAKPMIPAVPNAGIGKLPNGWRMVTSDDGRVCHCSLHAPSLVHTSHVQHAHLATI